MQRVDKLSIYKCNIYSLVLPWYNNLLKSLMVKSIICMGEPVDRHLNDINKVLVKFQHSVHLYKSYRPLSLFTTSR